MTCRELIDFLSDYLDGALPPAARSRFEEHLDACLDCQNYVESFKRTVRLGKESLADGEDAVPTDVPDALVQAILAARPPGGR